MLGRSANVTTSCISESNRLGVNNGPLPVHAARPMGLTLPLLRAAASPQPIPHNSDQLRRRECHCPHLPNEREPAYDDSSRNM
jgi:hypothetical protein